MKKFRLIILLVFCFALISGGGYLYLAKKYNVSFKSAVLWNFPGEPDLYAEASGLARSYPRVIAGNVEPAGLWMNRLLGDQADELKALGVNTVRVMPYYQYREGKAELWNPGVLAIGGGGSAKAIYLWQIVQAKKLGFAVFLTTNFVGPAGKIFGDIPSDTFLEDSARIALEWAEIAEDFNVEYFSPQGEIDLEISLNYFSHDWERRHEVMELANQWHHSLLPELRKVFGGKIAYMYTLESEHLDASGHDLVAVDLGPWNEDIDKFRENMRRRLEIARLGAKRAGASWMVGEFWVPNGESKFGVPPGINLDLYRERLKQEEFYKVMFEEYLRASSQTPGEGFTFGSFLMPGTGVAGRPAELLLAEFFRAL